MQGNETVGASSTCFWVDSVSELSFSFLSTGLMEETFHCERLQRLADLVVTSSSTDACAAISGFPG